MNPKKVAQKRRTPTPLDEVVALRDALAHTAMKELLRASAASQVLEDSDYMVAIARTAYRLADFMIDVKFAPEVPK